MAHDVMITVGECEKSPGFMSVRPKIILYVTVRIRSCRKRLTTKLSRLSLTMSG